MGLGPSWTIMSVMNSYAAIKAGAAKNSFAVNGDDIVGIWPTDVIDRYELICHEIGIVVNKDKSFRGKRGVFCEQIVEQEGEPGQYVSRAQFRLGELSGVKSIDGQKGHYVSDKLRQIASGWHPTEFRPTPPALRALASRTCQKVCLDRTIPGSLKRGGGGLGRADLLTLKTFLSGGSTSLRDVRKTREEQRATADRIARLKSIPSGNGPRVAEVLTSWVANDNGIAEAQGAWRERCKAKKVTAREHRKRISCRRAAAKTCGLLSLLSSDDCKARYGAKARSVCHMHAVHNRFDKAIDYLITHTRRLAAEALPQLDPLFPRELRVGVIPKVPPSGGGHRT